MDPGDSLGTSNYTDGITEGRSAENRLLVAHDPARAAEQAAKRRELIGEINA